MIPDFEMSGVLPPFIGDDPTKADNMSPYVATMYEVVDHFGTSPHRLVLLKGLLDFRQSLWNSGIRTGMQWLDGSFMENIEDTEERAPNDIDVVTFFHRPVPHEEFSNWVSVNRDLLDPRKTKTIYKCDAYAVYLSADPIGIVSQTRYWFGLFSHKRVSGLWKGMVQVPLDASDDQNARSLLEGMNQT